MEYFEITDHARNILIDAKYDGDYEIIITDIVLLTICLGKDNLDKILKCVKKEKELYKTLKDKEVYDEKNDIYIPLIDVIEHNDIPASATIKLLKYFMDFDKKELRNYLDYAVNEVLSFRELKDHASINWLNALIMRIMEDNSHRNTLVNMDCGYGKFLNDAKKQNIADKYIGFTSNYDNYVIGNYYNYVNHEKENVDFKINASFLIKKDLLNSSQKIDMIYTTHTFKKLSKFNMLSYWYVLNESFSFSAKRYSLNMLDILNGIELLNEEGILIALIPDGGLFNTTDCDIRKYLIEKNYLDTIISLPKGIIPGTNTPCSLVIVKKNRLMKQSIKMINARETYERKRRHLEFSDDNIAQILEWYRSSEINENVIAVSKDEIVEQDYNFEVTKYMKKNMFSNAATLGSISEKIFRGYQIGAKQLDEIVSLDDRETRYYLVNVSDVQAEGYIANDLQGVNDAAGSKLSKYFLEDGDLIITAKNSVVKSAVYKSEDDKKVILTGNLIVIRLDKNKCDPYYLQAFLNSEDGEMEIKSIQTGTTIKVINPKRLEEMLIPLKGMEEQKEISKKYERTVREIENLKNTVRLKVESLERMYENRL